MTEEEKNEKVDLNSTEKKIEQLLNKIKQLLKNALQGYIEYLNARKVYMDIRKEISQEESQKSYEDVKRLEKKFEELKKETEEEVSKKYKHYFQELAKECEYAKLQKPKEQDTQKQEFKKIYRIIGDYAYVQAIVNKREALYGDAKSFFEKAIHNYDEVTKDNDKNANNDAVLRRLGNACYELAAINMDNCSYQEAKNNFEKFCGTYEQIKVLTKDDYRNLGNAQFERGRLIWNDLLVIVENEEPFYGELIKKENDRIYEAENTEKLNDNDNQTPDEIDKMKTPDEIDKMKIDIISNFKDVTTFYHYAIKNYTSYETLAQGNDKMHEDVFRSWGDIYLHCGRKSRYCYLLLMEKIQILNDDIAKCNDDDTKREHLKEKHNAAKEEIKKEIKRSIRYFKIAIKKYEKVFNILKNNNNNEDEIEEINLALGVAHYRLFLTHCTKEYEEYYEKKDKNIWIISDKTDEIKGIAEGYFKSLKSFSVLDMFVEISMDATYSMMNNDILFSLLECTNNEKNRDAIFFNSIVEATSNDDKEKCSISKNGFKKIYIHSMYIISLLEIKYEHENVIAHYTQKRTSQKMLFEEKKFRLYAADYLNDPTCGKILPKYLFEGYKAEEEQSEYITFAGSFSFNYDNLNQFRLYGKEKEREGTGVSLVFNKTFFNEEFKQDRAAFLTDMSEYIPSKSFLSKLYEIYLIKIENIPEYHPDRLSLDQLFKSTLRKPRKNPLFRCIYFDRETEIVETVGQKEKYFFYREEKIKDNKEWEKNATGNYNKYTNIINNITTDVNNELKKLKELVDEREPKPNKKDKEIICQLIFKLRYLIKDVAYKTEQECRIVKTCKLNNAEEVSIDKDNSIPIEQKDKTLTGDLKMYYRYELEIPQHIKEIYLGPKFTQTESEMFDDRLKHENLHNIKCKKTTNPFV